MLFEVNNIQKVNTGEIIEFLTAFATTFSTSDSSTERYVASVSSSSWNAMERRSETAGDDDDDDDDIEDDDCDNPAATPDPHEWLSAAVPYRQRSTVCKCAPCVQLTQQFFC